MEYRILGTTALRVSALGLGTMTFGEQNTAAEAAAQLDCAFAAGVNFIDTAEMYPVPPRAETASRTEDYVGRWLKHRPRDQVILASKVTGPGRGFSWIRNGPRIDRKQVLEAVEGSLRRLGTDYLDLYQIHWPDRNVPIFGAAAFDPAAERETVPLAEQLAVFGDLVEQGKIRYFGVSNESAWGVLQFLKIAEDQGLPRIACIQNPYNLINRMYETTLAETSFRERIPLLAYSPLGFGILTGKYLSPEGTGRLRLFPGFGPRYYKPNVPEAVAEYVALATRYGMSPAQMAIAFVHSRPFVGSTLVGATTLAQLQEDLQSPALTLTPELLREIDAIHARFPNPAP
ncbi:MAG TPA: aldo/keto reductase [Acidiferrobacteraceae bacterium]|nr:aldo/keto reductase [Acidiferrobacteraceae bacterium]